MSLLNRKKVNQTKLGTMWVHDCINIGVIWTDGIHEKFRLRLLPNLCVRVNFSMTVASTFFRTCQIHDAMQGIWTSKRHSRCTNRHLVGLSIKQYTIQRQLNMRRRACNKNLSCPKRSPFSLGVMDLVSSTSYTWCISLLIVPSLSKVMAIPQDRRLWIHQGNHQTLADSGWHK